WTRWTSAGAATPGSSRNSRSWSSVSLAMGMRRFAACLGIAVALCVARPASAGDAPVPELAKHLAEVRKSATSAQVAAALRGVKPDADHDLAAALEAKNADTPGARAALDTARD